MKQDQGATGDGALVTVTGYDPLGRVRLRRQLDNGNQSAGDDTAGIKVQTRYLTGSGVDYTLVSNPYQEATSAAAATNPTMGWTRTTRDADGRTIATQSFDGSGLPAPWGSNSNSLGIAGTAYDAQVSTVTDQAGKKKKLTYDVFGRLAIVIEDPGGPRNYGTNYFYDAQDDLTSVSQGYCPDCQGRIFDYDSLRRLTSAANPESGTVSYGYDDNGNLITRTDARQITTSYQYDALNRLLKKTYPSGTPEVTYTYDTGATNGIGQLTQVSNSNSTTKYGAYDALGRVTESSQITGGQTYGFSYTYNLAGAQTSETYPSGRVVNTTYDAVNRVSGISTPAGSQTKNYVSNVAYWAHGALNYYAMGNLASASAPYAVYSYNSRLQMSSFHANIGNVENGYVAVWNNDFGTTDNNGNLKTVTERAGAPGTIESLASVFQQSFLYDEVNRLKHAEETNHWSRDFSYDQYGNMWEAGSGLALPGNAPTAASLFLNTGNRRSGENYDNAGNRTGANGDGWSYDAENRMVAAQDATKPAGHNTTTYVYDGDGRRVKKLAPDNTPETVYVYDAAGELAAEYSTAAAPATMACQTCYLVADHLGSTRLVMDEAGTVIGRHAYLPFGEEIPGGLAGRSSQWGATNDIINQKFTGKERDTETILDFFGARYFGSALGRFTSPDPGSIGAEPSDPQSWNAYSYVGNNPMSQTDPEGLDYHVCVNDQNGNQQCTNIANDRTFQQVAKNPGAGLSVSGDNGSGVIYSTDQNGNKVQIGTYQHFVGPGTERGGLQQDFGTELIVAGIGARVMDAGAGLIQGVAGIFGRRAGTAAVEDAAAAAGNAFRAGVNDVLQ